MGRVIDPAVHGQAAPKKKSSVYDNALSWPRDDPSRASAGVYLDSSTQKRPT